MPKSKTTSFRPPAGSKIYLEDTTNNNELLATVLNYYDKTDFRHHSSKGTPKENRFFYVKTKIEDKIVYIKLLNSIVHEECLSDDKRYRFNGKTTKGMLIKNKIENKIKTIPKSYSNESSSRIFINPLYNQKLKEIK